MEANRAIELERIAQRSASLIIAMRNLIREAELSLDRRPEFRAAISNAFTALAQAEQA